MSAICIVSSPRRVANSFLSAGMLSGLAVKRKVHEQKHSVPKKSMSFGRVTYLKLDDVAGSSLIAIRSRGHEIAFW